MKFRFPFGRSEKLDRPARAPATGDATPPLDAILAGLADGILAVDARKKVLLCNGPVSRLINRPPAEAVGMPLWEVLRLRPIHEMVDRVLRTGEEQSEEIPPSAPGAAQWQVRARRFSRDGETFGAVLMFSDVTNIRRLENVRRDFVANVSHELKTPLTALRAALETLLEGALEDPAHAREFLQTAQTNVERLQRLIDDLLTLARVERSEKRPAAAEAEFKAGAEKVLSTLRPLAEKSAVSIETDWPADALYMPLTEDELTQILMNLVDNGVKFNRSGGKVVVSAWAEPGAAFISVEDTGIGIPPADQPRVFERFYRVDKSHSKEREGTGLGLSIVKHIVESRGGSVSLDSVPDKGSSFLIKFPR